MIGISAFGAYVPRLRLQRSAIAESNAWFDASLRAHAKGERSMCNWDEDVVTMSVAAARDMGSSENIELICVGSTSFPFADRQNAGIVSEALNLGANVRTMDVAGSQRAGTSALLSGLDSVRAGVNANSPDNRSSRAISEFCRLSGIASGGKGPVSTYSSPVSAISPDSMTILVSSSTS